MQMLRARNLSEEFDEEQGNQAGKAGAEREDDCEIREGRAGGMHEAGRWQDWMSWEAKQGLWLED